MKFWQFILISVLSVSFSFGQNVGPICSRTGCATGLQNPGNLKPYEEFLGLPYSQPPTGRYRFENPRPPRNWGLNYNATIARSECIHINPFGEKPEISGDEDCLYLNVYRPKCEKCSSLPVIAFLHGGGFHYGSANDFGPQYFMDSGNVVLVTIQYRLGIFGFFSSGDDACPGNFGLKDQRMALRWIQRNIQNFGGDPKSVTLMGHGAGAASVQLHMMSSGSNGLFHRGVALSGSGIADWSIEVNPLKLFWKQVEHSGITKTEAGTARQAIRRLRRIGAYRLMEDSRKFVDDIDLLTIFKPCVEPTFGINAFLTDNPKTIWKAGTFKHKPFLLSFVPNEGGVFLKYLKSEESIKAINQDLDNFISSALEVKSDNVPQIKEYYLKGLNEITSEDTTAILRAVGDRHFYHPLYQTLTQYITYAGTIENPIFLMKFAYKGPFSNSQVYTSTEENYGIVHGDDLPFYFNNTKLYPTVDKNSLDGKMVHMMTQNIITFALTNQIQKWQPMSSCEKDFAGDICDYLVFKKYTKSDPNRILVSVSNEFDLEMVKFWDDIVDKNFE